MQFHYVIHHAIMDKSLHDCGSQRGNLRLELLQPGHFPVRSCSLPPLCV